MSEISWQFADGYAGLAEILAHPDWLGRAEIVKENQERTVYRLQTDGWDLHVKHLHPHGVLRSLVARWRGKAKREFAALRMAAQAGVPVSPPVGWGRSRSTADEYLLTLTIPAAISFQDAWQEACQSSRGHDLAVSLVQLADSMRQARLWHPDMHQGNVLASPAGGGWSLSLIDLHGARIVSALTRDQQFRMAMWLRPFLVTLDPASQEALLRASGLVAGPRDVAGALAEIAGRFVENRRLVWPGRRHRFLSDSSLCAQVHDHQGRWLLLRPFALEQAQRLLALREALATSAEDVLKADGKRSVARLEDGGCTYVVKAFAKRGFGRSHAASRQSWLNSHRLAGLAIPTARTYAWCRCDDGGALLIMEDLGPHSLHGALKRCPDLHERRHLLALAAEMVARLHGCRVFHRDLKVSNLLPVVTVAGKGEMAVLDLDSVTFHHRMGERQRVWNLCQLWGSIPPGVTVREGLRFLVLYGRSAGLDRAVVRRMLDRTMAQTRPSSGEPS